MKKSVLFQAIPDGNCSVNAFALSFISLFKANKLDEDLLTSLLTDFFTQHPEYDVDATINSAIEKFKHFLVRYAGSFIQQKILAPFFRARAATLLETDIVCQSDMLPILHGAFREFCLKMFGFSLLETGFEGDDIFIRIDGFQEYFLQLLSEFQDHKTNQTEENVKAFADSKFDQISDWWYANGFTFFVNHIRQDTEMLGDIELGLLTKNIGVGLRVHRNNGVYQLVPSDIISIELENNYAIHWDVYLPEADVVQYYKNENVHYKPIDRINFENVPVQAIIRASNEIEQIINTHKDVNKILYQLQLICWASHEISWSSKYGWLKEAVSEKIWHRLESLSRLIIQNKFDISELNTICVAINLFSINVDKADKKIENNKIIVDSLKEDLFDIKFIIDEQDAFHRAQLRMFAKKYMKIQFSIDNEFNCIGIFNFIQIFGEIVKRLSDKAIAETACDKLPIFPDLRDKLVHASFVKRIISNPAGMLLLHKAMKSICNTLSGKKDNKNDETAIDFLKELADDPKSFTIDQQESIINEMLSVKQKEDFVFLKKEGLQIIEILKILGVDVQLYHSFSSHIDQEKSGSFSQKIGRVILEIKKNLFIIFKRSHCHELMIQEIGELSSSVENAKSLERKKLVALEKKITAKDQFSKSYKGLMVIVNRLAQYEKKANIDELKKYLVEDTMIVSEVDFERLCKENDIDITSLGDLKIAIENIEAALKVRTAQIGEAISAHALVEKLSNLTSLTYLERKRILIGNAKWLLNLTLKQAELLDLITHTKALDSKDDLQHRLSENKLTFENIRTAIGTPGFSILAPVSIHRKFRYQKSNPSSLEIIGYLLEMIDALGNIAISSIGNPPDYTKLNNLFNENSPYSFAARKLLIDLGEILMEHKDCNEIISNPFENISGQQLALFTLFRSELAHRPYAISIERIKWFYVRWTTLSPTELRKQGQFLKANIWQRYHANKWKNNVIYPQQVIESHAIIKNFAIALGFSPQVRIWGSLVGNINGIQRALNIIVEPIKTQLNMQDLAELEWKLSQYFDCIVKVETLATLRSYLSETMFPEQVEEIIRGSESINEFIAIESKRTALINDGVLEMTIMGKPQKIDSTKKDYNRSELKQIDAMALKGDDAYMSRLRDEREAAFRDPDIKFFIRRKAEAFKKILVNSYKNLRKSCEPHIKVLMIMVENEMKLLQDIDAYYMANYRMILQENNQMTRFHFRYVLKTDSRYPNHFKDTKLRELSERATSKWSKDGAFFGKYMTRYPKLFKAYNTLIMLIQELKSSSIISILANESSNNVSELVHADFISRFLDPFENTFQELLYHKTEYFLKETDLREKLVKDSFAQEVMAEATERKLSANKPQALLNSYIIHKCLQKVEYICRGQRQVPKELVCTIEGLEKLLPYHYHGRVQTIDCQMMNFSCITMDNLSEMLKRYKLLRSDYNNYQKDADEMAQYFELQDIMKAIAGLELKRLYSLCLIKQGKLYAKEQAKTGNKIPLEMLTQYYQVEHNLSELQMIENEFLPLMLNQFMTCSYVAQLNSPSSELLLTELADYVTSYVDKSSSRSYLIMQSKLEDDSKDARIRLYARLLKLPFFFSQFFKPGAENTEFYQIGLRIFGFLAPKDKLSLALTNKEVCDIFKMGNRN
ncbi:MAG: hypothetical protein K2X50_05125 [Gammaproteobacteria bacterium]|nr:hypothetical protein [Gammaproteobacteria bacterium]